MSPTRRSTRATITIERPRRHPLWHVTVIASICLLLVMVALPLWKLRPLSHKDAIPLHYNVTFGVDLLGSWLQIFYLPLIGFTLLCANVLFERLTVKREKILSLFFLSGTLLAEVILFVAVVLIVLLNL